MPPELKQIHAAGPTSTKNKGFTFYIWHSFDCFAKRMGAPKGLFSPAWPLLLSLSIIQCVKASQPPTLPPCLFHTAYVVPASHPCHCLLSLITHTQPSCHFVQDADGAVCVCVSALYVKCSIWLSFLFFPFFFFYIMLMRSLFVYRMALADLTVRTDLLFTTKACLRMCKLERMPARPAGRVQVSSRVCVVSAATRDQKTWAWKNQSITDSLSLYFLSIHVSKSQK